MNAEFTVRGKPQGKARPRVTSHGTFTSKKTKEYETLVQFEYNRQCKGIYFGNGAITVDIIAYFTIPQSKPRMIRAEMYDGKIRPKTKPDTDNIAKAILDALNGIAFHDDAQIVRLRVEKWYDTEPRVYVMIGEAG